VVLLAILLAAILLLVITVHTLGSSSASTKAAATTSPGSPAVSPAGSTPIDSSSPSLASSSGATTAATTAAAPSSSAPAAVQPCVATALKIVSAADKPSYKVGDQPVVALQVTNIGAAPCTEALGDAQIEFRIYNGAARVWGSHDCKIDPTADVETLPINSTVAKTITWSGYSSETDCGVRQRVGAGTYTLTAYLAGTAGTPAQFSITG
jgi:hypothetical protein